MTYDEELAGRLRELLSGQHALTERKMFGGLAFLINGNMCCGVHGNELILRLGSDRADQAMEEPHVRAMDITGRPMKGWVILDPVGLPSKAAVRRWVEQAAEFAASLPAK
jgi:TfoX/Sxy family transcriptional regulator of competence genes